MRLLKKCKTLRAALGGRLARMGRRSRWELSVLMGLALALGLALAALAVYFFWKKPSSWLERWVFILIFSGGLGNLIDRVLNGYVVDFFATTFMNFAVFNVADCFVCVGAALFVIAVLRQELNAKKEQKAGTDENA